MRKVHSNTSESDAEQQPACRVMGVLVDQVVAVVNGDLVLESDVDEDRRFQTFLPFTNPGDKFTRDGAIERLIDRTLILQQAKLQPDSAVTDAEVQTQLHMLRKEIPACKQYDCETDAGWTKFVNHEGFTVDELNERWKQRMQVLRVYRDTVPVRDRYLAATDQGLLRQQSCCRSMRSGMRRRRSLRAIDLTEFTRFCCSSRCPRCWGLVEVAEGAGNGAGDDAG